MTICVRRICLKQSAIRITVIINYSTKSLHLRNKCKDVNVPERLDNEDPRFNQVIGWNTVAHRPRFVRIFDRFNDLLTQHQRTFVDGKRSIQSFVYAKQRTLFL